jgi:hypothetical protein
LNILFKKRIGGFPTYFLQRDLLNWLFYSKKTINTAFL